MHSIKRHILNSILIFSGSLLFGVCTLKAQVATQLVAGSGSTALQNGPGPSAGFEIPVGIDFDGAGNLYIGDDQNHAIRKITPSGIVSTLAGNGSIGFMNGTGTAARFNRPHEICIDSLGNIYVADNNNHVIRKVTPLGVTTTVAGTGANGYVDGPGNVAEFSEITGLCIDEAGNLYASDRFNHYIRKITPLGVVTTIAGNGINGITNGPALSSSIGRPWGMDYDQGKLYIAQFDHHLVRVLDLSTNMVSTFAGTGVPGFNNGQRTIATFNGPVSVEVANSTVFVTDYFNHAIRQISPDGEVSTLVGLGVLGYIEGPSTIARLNMPINMAYNYATSELYFTDRLNNRVRKITCMISNMAIFPADTVGSCLMDSIMISAPSGLDHYNWNTGDTLSSIYVSSSGTYHVSIEDNGCMAHDSITVFDGSNTTIDLGDDTTLCEGETLLLSASGLIAQLWSTGETSPSIIAAESGMYTVQGVDAYNCSVTDTILISLLEAPIPLLDHAMSNCGEDTVWVNASATYPGAELLWQDGTNVDSNFFTVSGIYSVNISYCGTSLIDTFSVTLKKLALPPVVPNVFTPNNDGVNDFYEFSDTEEMTEEFQCEIYNRWGMLVAYGNSDNFKWDGSINGQPAQEGIYFVLLKIKMDCDNELRHTTLPIQLFR